MKICFFGASVSEQHIHSVTNEITGFVTAFKESNLKYNICRVTSGSNSIDDAGIVYVHKVVNEQPDICIIDWATPASINCNQKSISHVYGELIAAGILPVTLILPRSDRNQKDTPIYRLLYDYTKRHGLPFWDFQESLKDLDHSTFLKDSVHTNSFGAKIYANLISEYIDTINFDNMKVNSFSDFKPVYFLGVSKELSKENHTKKINIDITSSRNNNFYIKFFLEQRVGPWSSFLDVFINQDEVFSKISEVELFDPWCWRERQCLKDISGWLLISGKKNTLQINQSCKVPNYKSVAEKFDFYKQDKHIRPKGCLYYISDQQEDIDVTVSYSN